MYLSPLSFSTPPIATIYIKAYFYGTVATDGVSIPRAMMKCIGQDFFSVLSQNIKILKFLSLICMISNTINKIPDVREIFVFYAYNKLKNNLFWINYTKQPCNIGDATLITP